MMQGMTVMVMWRSVYRKGDMEVREMGGGHVVDDRVERCACGDHVGSTEVMCLSQSIVKVHGVCGLARRWMTKGTSAEICRKGSGI